jgi:sialate O-acetylesterase
LSSTLHIIEGGKHMTQRLVTVSLLLAVCSWADIKLASLIGDHMVLQRDSPVRIFGQADPGESVAVSFQGQKLRTTADSLGNWELWLAPMRAGAAGEMTVEGKNSIRIRDILVGDVWVGSGQSNMQWSVQQSDNAKQEIATAKHPQIRLFYVPRKTSPVPLQDVDARWTVCSPDTIGEFSAVLYYFGRDLEQNLKVPMGLIHSSWGGTPIVSWISGTALTTNPQLAPMLTFWEEQISRFPQNQRRFEQNLKKWTDSGSKERRPQPPLGPGHHHEPSTLYNAMIAPLKDYTIKGAIWYQGESEAGRAQGHLYGEALKTMVRDWRRAFAQGDFPFFWVQLANYGNAAKNGHWMRVQEGQVQATALRNTGVAVINDIGAADDIHPRNKQDVGKRLALLARHVAYGQNGFAYSGPIYRQTTREGDKYRVWFDQAEGLRTRDGGPLKGFSAILADGTHVPAEARIDGATVVVSALENAQAVAYAWDYNPDANLVNGAGLPASLFRSDDRDEFVLR